MTFDKLASLANNYFLEAKVRPPTKEEITNPYSAFKYAKDVVKGRVPELEPLILTDSKAVHNYLYYVVKNRWPEAEEIISTSDPSDVYLYASEFLKDRWINIPDIPKIIAKQAENRILSEPYTRLNYAINVIEGRWPELEEVILGHPNSEHEKEQYLQFLRSIDYQDLEESFKLR